MNVLHGQVVQCFSNPQVSTGHATTDGDGATDGSSPRILAFLHAPGPGGVERIALRLIAGWQRAGVAVHLVLCHSEGPLQAEMTPGIAIQSVPSWPLVGQGLRPLRMVLACLRAIRAHRPDILFCAGNVYTIIAVLLKLRLGRRCPLILAKISNDLIRGDMPWVIRPFYTLWLRIQGRAIDRFAALSDPMAREVAARMHVDRARIHVVPNPVLSSADLDDLAQRLWVPGTGRRFVAVGRLERQKDYPLMLRAFAAGSGPDDTLTIFGEGRARSALENLTRQLGIDAKVRFAGFSTDVRHHLQRHDVLLLSSRYEGQPGAVVEALASGIAIIATRCCASMAPLLDDGALGSLVERDNEAAFANAIRTAQPGSQDRPRAREKAAAFTIERAVPAYRALFRQIMTTSARRRREAAAAPYSQSCPEAQLS